MSDTQNADACHTHMWKGHPSSPYEGCACASLGSKSVRHHSDHLPHTFQRIKIPKLHASEYMRALRFHTSQSMKFAAEKAFREAAKEWGGTERIRMETVGKWLRARADEYRIPPDRYEHRCGYDYYPWCDGCRAAYRDAGMEV